jgi:hypothetical protein
METSGNGDEALACMTLSQELPTAFARVKKAIQVHLGGFPNLKVSQ